VADRLKHIAASKHERGTECIAFVEFIEFVELPGKSISGKQILEPVNPRILEPYSETSGKRDNIFNRI